MEKSKPQRRGSPPVFLNLIAIKLPVAGIVSFLHRISGIILVVSLPFGLWAFNRSLSSKAEFEALTASLNLVTVRLALALIFWSLCHHILAGIRFLLLDRGIGVEKKSSARFALVIMIISMVILLELILRAVL